MSATRRAPVILRRDPFRLLISRAPWASAWYLFSYLFAGTVLFVIVVTATTLTTALSFTLAGLPLLLAAAAVVRGCAAVERARLRFMSPKPVRSGYQTAAGPGLLAGIKARWSDPATWRDIAYLAGMFAPLIVLDWAVLGCWLVLLAGVTLPAWYQYPRQTWGIGVNGGSASGTGTGSAHGVQLGYFPNGPHGHPAWGLYVDTLPKALAVAGVCLVLFLIFNYVLVATTRLHAAIARALLRAPQDPLREAREVLRRPGPLSALNSPGPLN
jgi:hypothetical protein